MRTGQKVSVSLEAQLSTYSDLIELGGLRGLGHGSDLLLAGLLRSLSMPVEYTAVANAHANAALRLISLRCGLIHCFFTLLAIVFNVFFAVLSKFKLG